ncbi:MAG: hypothetical protein AAB452_00875 [Patescibacteria group bacterium]
MTTWQVALFVLFAVSVLTYLAAKVIQRLQERWTVLPDFVWNRVGGVVAVCAVSDFHNPRNQRIRGYVLVPDTLTFSDHQHPIPGRWFSTSVPYLFTGGFDSRQYEHSLFVPFASERYLANDTQANLLTFTGPHDNLDMFVQSKTEANLRYDVRRRFAAFVTRNESTFLGIRFASLVMVVAFSAGLFVNALSQNEQDQQAAPAVLYTTTVGSSALTEFRGTRMEIKKLPVGDLPVIGPEITMGPVVTVMPIGGDMNYVCILRQSDDGRICGFATAALGLKKGETGYLRTGFATLWINSTGGSHAELARWAISEQEALALRDKAGYRIKK